MGFYSVDQSGEDDTGRNRGCLRHMAFLCAPAYRCGGGNVERDGLWRSSSGCCEQYHAYAASSPCSCDVIVQ